MFDEKKAYYLKKGTVLSKEGLPGGKLDASKADLQIDKKYYPVMGMHIDYLISQKKCAEGLIGGKEEQKDPENHPDTGNDEAGGDDEYTRLVKEAEGLGIKVPAGIKLKKLEKKIAEKKAEIEKAGDLWTSFADSSEIDNADPENEDENPESGNADPNEDN